MPFTYFMLFNQELSALCGLFVQNVNFSNILKKLHKTIAYIFKIWYNSFIISKNYAFSV